MDKNKAISYLESSFLSNILKEKDVTDISYNGKDIFYVTNIGGRKKSDVVIEHQTAKDFLRQIANIAEKQFSFTSPNLDTSFGKYRLNATHQSIGRLMDEGVVTFALRIASEKPRINDDSDFFTPEIVELLKLILSRRYSIVIGGITGTGKTEFQKYLIRNMRENERVVVIDNVMELDQVRNDKIDLTCWQVIEDNPNAAMGVLVKNALRNNPDWLIAAEARSEEMINVLESAMTGLPVITTLHSFDASSIPSRMGRMILKNSSKLDYQETLSDIYYHFHFYIYLKKEEIKGKIIRYISEINYIDDNGKILQIYQRYKGSHKYEKFKGQILKDLEGFDSNKLLAKTFGKEKHE